MAGLTLEELEINFKANSAKFTKELNKVNRTLSAQRAELRRQQDQTSQYKDSLVSLSNGFDLVKSSGSGYAATAAAIVTATAAATIALSNNVRELDNLARQTGVSAESFKALDFAARQFSMTGEQVADITKDIKDKAQEFARDGTGAFTDFATEIGLAEGDAKSLAAEMVNLSGDQAMGLVIKRMEELGLNSNQMVQATESLGNDFSKLIPLFKDGGQELDRLNERFAKLTSPLSESEVKQFRDLSESADLVKASFISMLENAITPALPAINGLTNAVADFFAKLNTESQVGLEAEKERLETALKFQQAQIETNYLLAEDAELTSPTTWFNDATENVEILNQKLAETKAKLEALKEQNKGQTIIPSGGGGGGGSGSGSGAPDTSSIVCPDSSEDDSEDLEKRLDKQKEFNERLSKLKADALESDFARLTAYEELEIQQLQEKYEKENQMLIDAGIAQSEIDEAHLLEREEIRNEYAQRESDLEAQKLEAMTELLNQKDESEKEKLLELQESYQETFEELGENFADTTAEMIVNGESLRDGLKSAFKDIAKTAISTFIQIATKQLATQAAAWMAEGQTQQALTPAKEAEATANATTSFAKAPWPINLGAPAFGLLIGGIVGAKQAEAASAFLNIGGKAHKGMDNIPEESTWLLNGGERVIAPEQNKDLTQFLSGGGKSKGNDLQMTVNINAENNVSVDEFFESNISNFGDQIGIAALDFIQRAS